MTRKGTSSRRKVETDLFEAWWLDLERERPVRYSYIHEKELCREAWNKALGEVTSILKMAMGETEMRVRWICETAAKMCALASMPESDQS